MDDPELPNPPHADALAIEAIRHGDRERYRELVDRYADKVYAVAWSRLGDRSLAEEAAQEAFIAGYRRLSLLTRSERFGAWITTIARRTAINLGLRQRREIDRRERWALEHESDHPSPHFAPSDDPPPATTETLQDTLATLPPTHRECLVLFYLQKRSITEAAHTLGISEAAFKVRLHRARAALRDALEDKLETGLDRLRAPTHLSSAVMVALPASAPGALVAGGLWGTLVKALPFGTSLLLLQLLMLLPALALMHWLGMKEIANVRDQHSPLAAQMRRDLRFRLFLVPTIILGNLLVLALLLALARTLGFGPLFDHAGDLRTLMVLLGALVALASLPHLYRMRWVRPTASVIHALSFVLIGIFLVGAGLFEWRGGVLFMAQAIFMGLGTSRLLARPPGTHTSLIQHAASGALHPQASSPPPPPPNSPSQLHRPLAFARFLCQQGHLDHAYPQNDRWILTLVPPRPRWINGFRPRPPQDASQASLLPDGQVQVVLGQRDLLDLARLLPSPLPSAADIEARLAQALRLAWHEFAAGNETAAAALLQPPPLPSPFLVPPDRTSAWRIRLRTTQVLATFVFAFGAYDTFVRPSPELARIRRLQPVSISETDIRNFLAGLEPGTPRPTAANEDWFVAAQNAWRLPPPHLFPPAVLHAIRSNALARLAHLQTVPLAEPQLALRSLCFDPVALNLAASGLLDPDHLARLGITPERLRQGLQRLSPSEHAELFGLRELPIVIDGERRSHLWVPFLARRTEFLRLQGCLDALDLRQASTTLVASQILPGRFPTNRWGARYQRDLQGLFATGRPYVLPETADTLEILDAAQALDRIDREACIRGILRFHHGQGIFAPRSKSIPGAFNGDHRDTFAAYRALRTLRALDRVPDLDRWQFRPPFNDPYRHRPGHAPYLASEHLEAYCLRQAFHHDRSPHTVPHGSHRGSPQ